MPLRRCDSCSNQEDDHTSIHSVCYDCREFYCEPCADSHLTENSHSHDIFDLVPRKCPPSPELEETLSSDFSCFLKTYTAQVAKESASYDNHCAVKLQCDSATSGDADLSLVKCSQFTAKRHDEKKRVYVTGILAIGDKIMILDHDKKELKVFDEKGTFKSCVSLITYPSGITCVSGNTFATCGYNKKIYNWNLIQDSAICSEISYDVNYAAYGIHYNGTYYCVLHRIDNAVTILDKHGNHVREIKHKKVFQKKVQFGWDIHMDSETHDIYVPCIGSTSGVLCLAIHDEIQWFTSLQGGLRGITEIQAHICVADNRGNCVHLLSKAGNYKNRLLEKGNLGKQPSFICFDGLKGKLYVDCITNSDTEDEISVFSVH